MNLNNDGWPRNTIGHLFYTTSSFVHHFKAIGDLKLELQSCWSKLMISLSHVTMKLDRWPWKTIGYYEMASFVHNFIAISWLKLELQSWNAWFGSKSVIFIPCELHFWWMTLKKNMAHLRCYVKLCASSCSHRCIQTGVTVLKHSVGVKISNF